MFVIVDSLFNEKNRLLNRIIIRVSFKVGLLFRIKAFYTREPISFSNCPDYAMILFSECSIHWQSILISFLKNHILLCVPRSVRQEYFSESPGTSAAHLANLKQS